MFCIPLSIIIMHPVCMSQTTSRQLLESWMDASRGNLHFSKWRAKRKDHAIMLCGLAKKFKNNKERDWILGHLSTTDLPLLARHVLKELDDRGIVHSHESSRQQKALLLLKHMAEGLESPSPPTPVLIVKAPGREELAAMAREVVRTHTFGEHCVPYAYKFNASINHLWLLRRRVSICHHPTSLSPPVHPSCTHRAPSVCI